jgi:hypothetical protein
MSRCNGPPRLVLSDQAGLHWRCLAPWCGCALDWVRRAFPCQVVTPAPQKRASGSQGESSHCIWVCPQDVLPLARAPEAPILHQALQYDAHIALAPRHSVFGQRQCYLASGPGRLGSLLNTSSTARRVEPIGAVRIGVAPLAGGL